jgi:hypothetical protein
LTEAAGFASLGLACALGDDALYRAAASRVECCNFQVCVCSTVESSAL